MCVLVNGTIKCSFRIIIKHDIHTEVRLATQQYIVKELETVLSIENKRRR